MTNVVIPVALALGTAFTIWTVRWMALASRKAHSVSVFRYGVNVMGLAFWIGSTVSAAIALYDLGPIAHLWLCVLEIAFLALPICLWAGYWWGRGMQALLGSTKN